MKLDRNDMAAGIFNSIMASASNLGTVTPAERRVMFDQVTDLCFEMADAFIERANQLENSK